MVKRSRSRSGLRLRTVDQLTIEDDSAFRHVGLYADLTEVLRRSRYRFKVLPKTRALRGDRALLLNLTFWGGEGDVLVDEQLPADVVTHVAWHHLASGALSHANTAEALFLGEAIASAFDVYLVGRLLGHPGQSSFLDTQVPAMAEAASASGLSSRGFNALLRRIATSPEESFEQLRALLFDATSTLVRCDGVNDAFAALESFDEHPFAPLLHHYELSNWVLYARAYADGVSDRKARALDRRLRSAPDALDLLTREWVLPTLGITPTRDRAPRARPSRRPRRD
jgi:hypothetical protein